MNDQAADEGHELGDDLDKARCVRLNAVIVACRDSGRGHGVAADHAITAEERKELRALSRRRGTMVRELAEQIPALGGTAAPRGSIGAFARRAFRSLWRSAAGATHQGESFQDCARLDASAAERYTRALRLAWPGKVDALLRAQKGEIDLAHDRMRARRGQT